MVRWPASIHTYDQFQFIHPTLHHPLPIHTTTSNTVTTAPPHLIVLRMMGGLGCGFITTLYSNPPSSVTPPCLRVFVVRLLALHTPV